MFLHSLVLGFFFLPMVSSKYDMLCTSITRAHVEHNRSILKISQLGSSGIKQFQLSNFSDTPSCLKLSNVLLGMVLFCCFFIVHCVYDVLLCVCRFHTTSQAKNIIFKFFSIQLIKYTTLSFFLFIILLGFLYSDDTVTQYWRCSMTQEFLVVPARDWTFLRMRIAW